MNFVRHLDSTPFEPDAEIRNGSLGKWNKQNLLGNI